MSAALQDSGASKRAVDDEAEENIFAPAAKRARVSEEKKQPEEKKQGAGPVMPMPQSSGEYDFRMSFAQPASVKQMITILTSVLDEGHFHVTVSEDFQGIFTNSLDSNHVCMVTARQAASVTDVVMTGTEPQHFCVNMGTLHAVLKAISSSGCLEMYKKRDSDRIWLKGFESVNSGRLSEFDVPLLNSDADNNSLQDIDFKYTVEIDLAVLERIIKASIWPLTATSK